jgi:hypothetical protein
MKKPVFSRGNPTLALAYVCVDDTSADETAQRKAIHAWAERERVTIVAWHVSHGPTSDFAELKAAIDALPTHGVGWLIVASLDRLHPEGERIAGVFDTLANEKGARLDSADGAFAPKPGQQCPICHFSVHPSTRYPRALCGLCMFEATDEHGRRLSFFNVDMTGGFRAVYADSGEEREGHVCYVRGVRCWADEARFGGIVIEQRS